MGKNAQIFWWSLFDFANSIVIINLGLYFSQWLVIEKGISAFWYNFMDVLATILLLLTIPIIGLISDRLNKRVLFMKLTAIPIVVFTFLIGFFGKTFEGIWPVLASILFFLLIIYFYQLSLLFYHTMLGTLAQKKKYGRISGVGLAAGWLGAIVGLLIILPFVNVGGRINAFIPSALIFGVLVAISLVFLKEPKTAYKKQKRINFKDAYKNVIKDIKFFGKKPDILYFLVAYWLFIDAILTIQDNFPLYLEIVLKIPDTQKVFLGALLMLMAAVGALVIGKMGDKIGHKKMLTAVILGWIAVLVLFLQASILWHLIIAVSLIGILFGGTWATTRALYLMIIPKKKRGEYFGFYACSERFASIIGPLIWGGIVAGLTMLGPLRYKVAVVSMILLIGLSLIFLRKVRIISANQ